jgi:hypothetical protein
VGAYCYSSANIDLIYDRNKIFPTLNSNKICSFQDIDACQHIVNRSLLFELSHEAGFASEINNLLNAFAYSVATRRRLFIDGKGWNYGQFETYFDVNKGHFSPLLPHSFYCQSRKFVYLKETTVSESHLRTSRDVGGYFHALNNVLINFEKMRDKQNLTRLGTIEIKRYVAQYLWATISRRTEGTMKKLMKDASLPNNITFAIHVRQGDKVKEAHSLPLLAYIHGIEKLASIYNGE